MLWIDMHCDTLSEIQKKKLCSGGAETLETNNFCVDIGRLEKAECCAQFFACFVNAADYAEKRHGLTGSPDVSDHVLWDRAYRAVLQLTDLAREAENSRFQLAGRRDEFVRGEQNGAVKGILTVEEGGVLNGRPERLEELYMRGVRLLTLTWNYENSLGSPNSRDSAVMERGLTPFGCRVVEQMNDLGMLIDVSHLSDGGFWECIRRSRAPVVASHSNARSLCPHPRNLTDEMLKALGEKGGVVGVNFYSAFLRAAADNPGADPAAGIDDILRHFCYIIDKAGEDAAALGTDFDGFEKAFLPRNISGVQDMGKLWDAMEKAGFTARQIEKAAYGNVVRVIREVWK